MRIMNGSTHETELKNSVPGVEPFVMHFDDAYYDRIDLWNGVFHPISMVIPFIMRI